LTSFPKTLARSELGRKQVLDVEDWAEIRRLRRAEGLAISEIARVMGVARNTVKAALAADGPPRYRRAPRGSLADGFEPQIRELLAAYPTMPATVIAERIGWPYSIRTLSGRVAQLRPWYLPADPVGRTGQFCRSPPQPRRLTPEFAIPVADQEVKRADVFAEVHRQVAGGLSSPDRGGMSGHAENVDPASADFH
jgi:Helix-turn-helix domain of resolvase